MRITKQPSGGRGEYEIAENAPNGLTPVSLLDHDIYLRIGTHLINTGVKLVKQGGKRRLRRVQNSYPQVQIQVANILLLPSPVRDERQNDGRRTRSAKRKVHSQKHQLRRGETVSPTIFEAEVRSIDCANQAHDAEQIKVPLRMEQIETLWRRRSVFPPEIASLLLDHQRYVESTNPIPGKVTTLVKDLQARLLDYADDLDVVYSPNTDVLPVFLTVLDIVIQEIPVSLEQIEPEQLELRKREVRKWQQYVSRRGAASVRFKREVREAYDFCCVVCGLRLPSTSLNINPGVDAAHILPWATYDLDKPYNGLCLCKLHHWAFDEHLITLTHHDDTYFVELAKEAEELLMPPEFSIDALKSVVGPIPEGRLPINRSYRPHIDILQRRNAETV